MSKFWAFFLLCGLLSPSQGLVGQIPVVSQVDKEMLENAITGSLTKGDLLQGVLGSLVGGDQLSSLVSGLLGGDGLVGGLLGGDGLVGGLLGGDGLVGGLLGGNGLGGGLLGGNGLGGGLLGKQGLLSAVQGLTGLKIVNITLPKITLRFLPGIGLELKLYTQLLIDGGSAAGGLLRAHVEANIVARARLAQDASGALRLVIEDCRTLLGDITIHLGPKLPVLDQALKSVLGGVLPKLLCPVVDTVLGVVNSLLGTVTSVLPLGALGNLQYTLGSLPIIGDKSIELDLNLLVRDAAGNVIDPGMGQVDQVDQVGQIGQLGQLGQIGQVGQVGQIVLPPAASGVSQLGLPPSVFSAVLGLLRGTGALDADISSGSVQGAASIPLSTSALLSAMPQLAAAVPPGLPLMLQVRSAGVPIVSLRNGRATARLAASVTVLAARPGAPPQPLCTLLADINLNIGTSLSGNKLLTSLSIDRIALRQEASSIGDIDVSLLEGWIRDILRVTYLPNINNVLGEGIPLPNLFNIDFEDADIDIVDNGFVISQSRKIA